MVSLIIPISCLLTEQMSLIIRYGLPVANMLNKLYNKQKVWLLCIIVNIFRVSTRKRDSSSSAALTNIQAFIKASHKLTVMCKLWFQGCYLSSDSLLSSHFSVLHNKVS